MKQKFTTLLIILFISCGNTLSAQECITTTGGKTTGSGGNVEYTVGQIFYSTDTGTNGSAAQGVQQPYEILIISGIDDTKTISLTCSAYPNPTTDMLTLRVDNNDIGIFFYHLYDIIGNLLEANRINSEETTISMVGHQPAIYILKITNGSKTLKSFKIIKK